MLKPMKRLLHVMILALCVVGMSQPMATQAAEESVGKQILGGLVDSGKQALKKKIEERKNAAPKGEKGQGVSLSDVGDLVMLTMDGVTSKYKAEGVEYARTLGRALADPIVQHPQVQTIYTRVKVMMWVVTIYLTLVTVLLVCLLIRLSSSNKRILELLEAQAKKG